jgi:hypothetical protein
MEEKDIEDRERKEAPFHSYMIPPNLEGKRGVKEKREKETQKKRSSAHSVISAKRLDSEYDRPRI